MSYMFEVYYKPPHHPGREAMLTKQVARLGGRLSFREEPEDQEIGAICLTYEFDEIDLAEKAADSLRRQGEHIEGPADYGL